MNELTPSDVDIILWSDADEDMDSAILNKTEFREVLTGTKIQNEILGYGNIHIEQERHHQILTAKDGSLSSYTEDPMYLYTTWILDKNNDLWCIDRSFTGEPNYYLFREFTEEDENVKMPIKLALAMDLDNFKIINVTSATKPIGPEIRASLDMVLKEKKEIESIKAEKDFIRYCEQMRACFDQQIEMSHDQNLDKDAYTDFLVDVTKNWMYAKSLRKGIQISDEESMHKYVNTNRNFINDYLRYHLMEELVFEDVDTGKEL